ncbi:hypothetical protein Xoosp13_26 [Xanthomonas phage Xoo-sp13]|nr:hypothetical protein Xoosp13_26 [Xanthomonas phage Xoo-sp13]
MNTIRDEIRKHAALAFFGSAFADQADEAEQPMHGEIMNQLPDEIDSEALAAADDLLDTIFQKNLQQPVELLTEIQQVAAGDREPTAAMFGHYLAMQAMGHGVGLYDAFGEDAAARVIVPDIEFGPHSLSRNYFE